MQFLTVNKNLTLAQLSDRVGERNVDTVLNTNSIARSVNIGNTFYNRQQSGAVDRQTKINLLNMFVGSKDLYEKAALGSEKDWWSLANYGCFSDAIKIPETIWIPPAKDVLGNDEPIDDNIYEQCVASLREFDYINPIIFASEILAGALSYGIINPDDTQTEGRGGAGTQFPSTSRSRISPFQSFKIPWGMITLSSSLDNSSIEIPAYPEELNDGYKANFSEMPELLYQYEPWQVYKNSGPRQQTFTFHLHRDLWTGDRNDGNANKLIRYCESNCFPDYSGSAVNMPQVSLYISGRNYITGVMTSCEVNWTGPLAPDGFYLEFTLTFTIIEVSPSRLNYKTMRQKGLIG